MKNDLIKKEGEVPTEEIVIPDECGDTMWDAVLKPPPPPEWETVKTLRS